MSNIAIEKELGMEVVYCTHLFEGEYDYLPLNDINQITIKPTNITTINDDLEISERKLSYDLDYSYDKDGSLYVNIEMSLDDIDGCIKHKFKFMDMQDFVNEICHLIQQNLQIHTSEVIQNAIKRIMPIFAKLYFEETGRIIKNVDYELVAKLYNESGTIVGLANGFRITLDSYVENVILELDNIASYLPIEEIGLNFIEIGFNESKIHFNKLQIDSECIGVLKASKIKIGNMIKISEPDSNYIEYVTVDNENNDFEICSDDIIYETLIAHIIGENTSKEEFIINAIKSDNDAEAYFNDFVLDL